jgi:hypothetical protein
MYDHSGYSLSLSLSTENPPPPSLPTHFPTKTHNSDAVSKATNRDFLLTGRGDHKTIPLYPETKRSAVRIGGGSYQRPTFCQISKESFRRWTWRAYVVTTLLAVYKLQYNPHAILFHKYPNPTHSSTNPHYPPMLSNSPSKEEELLTLTPMRQPTTPNQEPHNDDENQIPTSESEDKQTAAETPHAHPQPATASEDQETPQQPLLLSGPGATKFGRGKRVSKPRDFFDPTAFAGSVQKKKNKKNPAAAAAPTPVQNNKNSLKRSM